MHEHGDLFYPPDGNVTKCVSDKRELTTCTMCAFLINMLMQTGFIKSTCLADAVNQ